MPDEADEDEPIEESDPTDDVDGALEEADDAAEEAMV